jgi:hypothetical protein
MDGVLCNGWCVIHLVIDGAFKCIIQWIVHYIMDDESYNGWCII